MPEEGYDLWRLGKFFLTSRSRSANARRSGCRRECPLWHASYRSTIPGSGQIEPPVECPVLVSPSGADRRLPTPSFRHDASHSGTVQREHSGDRVAACAWSPHSIAQAREICAGGHRQMVLLRSSASDRPRERVLAALPTDRWETPRRRARANPTNDDSMIVARQNFSDLAIESSERILEDGCFGEHGGPLVPGISHVSSNSWQRWRRG